MGPNEFSDMQKGEEPSHHRGRGYWALGLGGALEVRVKRFGRFWVLVISPLRLPMLMRMFELHTDHSRTPVLIQSCPPPLLLKLSQSSGDFPGWRGGLD